MSVTSNTIVFCGRKFYESPSPLELVADNYERVKEQLEDKSSILSCQQRFIAALNNSSGDVNIRLGMSRDGKWFCAFVEADGDGVYRVRFQFDALDVYEVER